MSYRIAYIHIKNSQSEKNICICILSWKLSIAERCPKANAISATPFALSIIGPKHSSGPLKVCPELSCHAVHIVTERVAEVTSALMRIGARNFRGCLQIVLSCCICSLTDRNSFTSSGSAMFLEITN